MFCMMKIPIIILTLCQFLRHQESTSCSQSRWFRYVLRYSPEMARMENMSDVSPRGYTWTRVSDLVVSDSSIIKLARWTHSHTLALQPLSKEPKCIVDFITCKQHAGFSHSDVQSFLYNGSQGGIEMTVAWNSLSCFIPDCC